MLLHTFSERDHLFQLSYSITSDNSGGKFRLQQSVGLNASQLLLNASVDYDTMGAMGYAYSLVVSVQARIASGFHLQMLMYYLPI